MANITPSPNMNLPIPNVGVDPGPDWAVNINSSLTILDQHNHSPGSGVQINPTGININADLPFNGNNATTLRSVNLSIQSMPLSSIADLGCLYVSGVDLWFNDENGNQIQMTSGGAVLATSSGISSGTASASFISSVLVVNAATNTPANIQGGSILLGNNTVSSKFLTLSPPNAMGANFGLVLPNIPVATSFMQLDTSGNMSASVPIANGITRSNLAAVGQQVSSSSGSVSITSAYPTLTDVTNLSVTLVTSGRPVMIMFMASSVGSIGIGQASGIAAYAVFNVVVDGTTIINSFEAGTANNLGNAALGVFVPPGSLNSIDTISSAGTHTYKLQAAVASTATTITIDGVFMVAYEL